MNHVASLDRLQLPWWIDLRDASCIFDLVTCKFKMTIPMSCVQWAIFKSFTFFPIKKVQMIMLKSMEREWLIQFFHNSISSRGNYQWLPYSNINFYIGIDDISLMFVEVYSIDSFSRPVIFLKSWSSKSTGSSVPSGQSSPFIAWENKTELWIKNLVNYCYFGNC